MSAPAESIFSLTARGGLADLLRDLAARLESGEATALEYNARVLEDRFELTLMLNTNP